MVQAPSLPAAAEAAAARDIDAARTQEFGRIT